MNKEAIKEMNRISTKDTKEESQRAVVAVAEAIDTDETQLINSNQ